MEEEVFLSERKENISDNDYSFSLGKSNHFSNITGENENVKKERKARHPSCQFKSDKSWINCQYHDVDCNSIKKPDEIENEMEDPPVNYKKEILDRIRGSMLGMALGDALGAHVEFRPREYLCDKPVEDLQGGGTWGLQKGQFTDDTSMALCLANSLIACKGFNCYDQLVRYRWWHIHGYMSSTGKCFDIGSATRQSLQEFSRRQRKFSEENNIPLDDLDFLSDGNLLQKFDCFCSEDGVAGNGALMRLAPLPLFFYKNPQQAIHFAEISAKITHGDQKAADACRYYAALIVAALNGETKEQLLDQDFYLNHRYWFDEEILHTDILDIIQGSFKKKGGYDEGIRGKGYVVQALEAALWAFWSDDNSFQKGVLAAVNLGDDTDTTAAIYGQLAGAFYGYDNLPSQWVQQIYAKKFIETVCKWIAYEGQRIKTDQHPISNNGKVLDDQKMTPITRDYPKKTDDQHIQPKTTILQIKPQVDQKVTPTTPDNIKHQHEQKVTSITQDNQSEISTHYIDGKSQNNPKIIATPVVDRTSQNYYEAIRTTSNNVKEKDDQNRIAKTPDTKKSQNSFYTTSTSPQVLNFDLYSRDEYNETSEFSPRNPTKTVVTERSYQSPSSRSNPTEHSSSIKTPWSPTSKATETRSEIRTQQRSEDTASSRDYSQQPMSCSPSASKVEAWPDPPCRTPPPAAGYTIDQYAGRWIEIGKIQTAGGAFFEKDCVCTHLNVAQTVNDPSKATVSNICNKKTFDGKLIVANGTLTSSKQPSDGRYNETFSLNPKPASYNIIALQTNEYSVEYDCTEEFGFTNYCVHILSRQNTLNMTIVNNLLELAQTYDLNPAKLDFVLTKHANCTYPTQI